jgi:hypothetical protein
VASGICFIAKNSPRLYKINGGQQGFNASAFFDEVDPGQRYSPPLAMQCSRFGGY